MLLLRHESCIECLMQDHAKYLHQPVESPDLIDVADPIKGIRKKITKSNKLGKKSSFDECNMLKISNIRADRSIYIKTQSFHFCRSHSPKTEHDST